MTILTTIGSRYHELTANEKRIFDLMRGDVKGFALLSIGDIASQLAISKTTLVRFAKSCGFAGYADFKRALQQEVLLEVSPVKKMQRTLEEGGEITPEAFCRQELDNIGITFRELRDEDLAAATNLFAGTEEMYTLSWGISTALAEIFTFRMTMMGVRCTPVTRRVGTLVEESLLLRSGDLVVVFELPPYNRETAEAVQKLHGRGAQLIVVTDSPRCPLTPFAALTFFCATGTSSFGNSLLGPLFWVNLVTSLVMYRKKERVLELLKERQASYNDDKYYFQ